MKVLCLVIGALCSLYTAAAIVQFEQSSYEINEDIGLEDRALRVCVLVDESSTISITTSSGTATENDDFDVFNEVIDIAPDSEDGCFGIIIWEDSVSENDEQFTIAAVDDSGVEMASTIVTILNDDGDVDDGLSIRFIDGTPFVDGLTVTFALEIGSEVEEVQCSVELPATGNAENPGPVDCTSGRATITLSRQRNTLLHAIARVDAPALDESPEIIRDINLGFNGRCTVNLIDDGVVIDRRDVTVTFRLTDQATVDPTMVGVVCNLAAEGTTIESISCTSPLVLSNLNPGEHTLSIRPNREGGCRRGIERSVTFTVL